jgi:TolB-like protein/DNA-binding winged helix-turn-helix (wHTH) protein
MRLLWGLMSTIRYAANHVLFRFDDFQLDPASGELTKFGRPIKLQPLHFKLLEVLVENHGQIVTREELRQRLWGPNTFVDFETSLNHCVRVLRATLSDDAQSPRFIETIPKRGYRFVGTVTVNPTQPDVPVAPTPVVEPPPPPPLPSASNSRKWSYALVASLIAVLLLGVAYWLSSRGFFSSAESRRMVILVLPFQNLTGDATQEYVNQGLTDEMISYLGKIDPVRVAVIARTSAFQYAASGKDLRVIARESGADYILEGSVRRTGSQIRVTADLIRGHDQTSVWTNSFDGEFSSDTLITLQSDLVRQIGALTAGALRINPAKTNQTNPEAYEAFLKGRYQWNRRTLDAFVKALDYYERAIQIDPKFAAAYAGKAETLALFWEYYEKGAPPNAVDDAMAAANSALELDETLVGAHAVMAFLEWRYVRDYGLAEREFRRALELDANSANTHHWYGLYLVSRGRFQEARAELEKARRLDPLSLPILTNIGWISHFERKYGDAVQHYREVTEMDPNFNPVHLKLIWAYQQQGKWDEAVEEQVRLAQIARQPSFGIHLQNVYKIAGYAGVLDAVIEANKTWGSRAIGEYELARMYTVKGDRETALRLLEQSVAMRSPWLPFLDVEPAFDPLRADPKFQALVKTAQSFEMLNDAAALRSPRALGTRQVASTHPN